MADDENEALKPYGYGEWLVRNRWWVLLFSLIGLVALSFGALNITFAEKREEYEALEKRIVRNDVLLLAIAPKDGNVFTRETLSAIEFMTAQSWQMPRALRVDSLSNYQHTRADGDDLVVSDLVEDAMSLSDEELAEIRKIALAEPLLVNVIVSDRGHVAGLLINILKGEDGAAAVVDALAHTDQMIADVKASHPDIDIYISGGIAADAAFGSAALNDSPRSGPFSTASCFWY